MEVRTAQKGFSLLELTVSLALAGAVAAFAFPQISDSNELSNDSQVKASLNAAIDAVVNNYAATGALEAPVDNGSGVFIPPAPDVSGATIRGLAPDILIASDGYSEGSWYREVSLSTEWIEEGNFWRVGAAAIADVQDANSATVACWMSTRDIEPEAGYALQSPGDGATLELYFVASGIESADSGVCTGAAALWEAANADVAAGEGTSWNNPAQVPPPAGLPPTPGPVSGTAGAGSVALTWSEVAPTISAPVTSLRVKYCTDTEMTAGCVTSADLDAEAVGTTVTGLTAGTTYYFRLLAVNTVGLSAGEVSPGYMPTGPPTSAGGLVATPTIGSGTSLLLSWNAVTPTAGRSVTGYKVLRHGEADSFFVEVADQPETTLIDTGLINGETYTYQIVAYGSGGEAAPSSSVTATPITAPAVASAPTAVAGNAQATVSWAALGTGNPGNPNASVKLKYCTDAGMTTDCVVSEDYALSATGATITGLANGSTYYFQLVVTNAVGATNGSVSGGDTPIGLPGSPGSLSGTGVSGGVDLTWAAVGGGTGANPVTSVAVRYCTNAGMSAGCTTSSSLASSASSLSVSGLDNGTDYYFTLIAYNAVGQTSGPLLLATPISAPAVLAAPTGVGGDTSVTLTFDSPSLSATTGAPISSVNLVRCTNAGMSAGCATTTGIAVGATGATVTGLTNGTTYYFRLVVLNSAGSTNGTVSTGVTAYGPPNVPSSVLGVAGDTQVVLTWTPVGAGTAAAPVSSVAVRYCTNAGMSTGCVTGSSLSTSASGSTITGLTNGTTYYFRLVATNGVGSTNGPVSLGFTPAVAVLVPAILPAPAQGSVASTQVVLTWAAPSLSATGGAPIDSVSLVRCTNAGMSTGCVTTTGIATGSTGTTVTGLTNGTAYYFRLVATNTAGSTNGTTSVAMTPITVPSVTPVAPTGVVGAGQVALTWTATGAGTADGPVTNVVVQRCTDAAMTTGCATGSNLANGAAASTVTGLTNGTAYYFRIIATNAVGQTLGAVSTAYTPLGLPVALSAPTRTATSTGALTLGFTAPSAQATVGQPITSVTVQRCTNASMTTACTTAALGSTAATSYSGGIASGLTNGTSYYFRLIATNAAGSTNGTTSAALVPITIPSVTPGAVTRTAGNGQVALTWASVGAGTTAAPVTNTQIQYCTNAAMTTGCATSALLVRTTTSLTITGLTNGTGYYFRVQAVNLAGVRNGATSAVTTPLAPPAVLPAPAGTTGDTAITFTWTAASTYATVAAPITTVVLRRCTDAAMTTACTTASVTTASTTYSGGIASGLTNGTDYYYRLEATNATGTTNGTVTSALAPGAIPSVTPGAVTGVAGINQVFLSWTAVGPGSVPAPVDYVRVKSCTDAAMTTGCVTSSSFLNTSIGGTITGLTTGTTYYFRLQAVNAVGQTQGAVSSGVTPIAAPTTQIGVATAIRDIIQGQLIAENAKYGDTLGDMDGVQNWSGTNFADTPVSPCESARPSTPGDEQNFWDWYCPTYRAAVATQMRALGQGIWDTSTFEAGVGGYWADNPNWPSVNDNDRILVMDFKSPNLTCVVTWGATVTPGVWPYETPAGRTPGPVECG